MVHCDRSTAATSRSVDGERLNTNALSGGTRPEKVLVFLARGREDTRGGRGTGTMIYTHTLNAVGAASAVRQTAPLARRQPLIPAEGSPPGHDRLQGAAA
jgi:hypothetical protein